MYYGNEFIPLTVFFNVSLQFKCEEHHKKVIAFKFAFLNVSINYKVDEMEHTRLNKIVFWKVTNHHHHHVR
jgi:hypothetical protein